MQDLMGKVVLITGASSGIGAAVAKGFGAHGARVVVHYHSGKEAAQAIAADIRAAGGQAALVGGDVREVAQMERVVHEAAAAFDGHLDILINNAGAMVRRCPIIEVPDDLFDEVIHTNCRPLIVAIRTAVPYMRKAGGGNIINVTSIAARHGGGPGAVLYAASKGFVSTLTRGLAKEMVKENIRVNAVSPGVITTPLHARSSTAEQLAVMQAMVPMGRLGKAEECVGSFLYLASDQMSGYVTGQVLEVNGGQLMP